MDVVIGECATRQRHASIRINEHGAADRAGAVHECHIGQRQGAAFDHENRICIAAADDNFGFTVKRFIGRVAVGRTNDDGSRDKNGAPARIDRIRNRIRRKSSGEPLVSVMSARARENSIRAVPAGKQHIFPFSRLLIARVYRIYITVATVTQLEEALPAAEAQWGYWYPDLALNFSMLPPPVSARPASWA